MFRTVLLASFLSAMTVGLARANPHVEQFHAIFSGFNEVGALNAQSGAILSAGRGTLETDRGVRDGAQGAGRFILAPLR